MRNVKNNYAMDLFVQHVTRTPIPESSIWIFMLFWSSIITNLIHGQLMSALANS
jgi:hypothetical protein